MKAFTSVWIIVAINAGAVTLNGVNVYVRRANSCVGRKDVFY